MVEVALDGVSKRYGETTALADASLSVRDGEFFTLVGPSGCGKTTTLRLIAGFEEPTAGTVRIGGESMAGVAPERRGLGVVFQSYALFPHMSVAENVGYGLRFAEPPGGASRRERIAELLEMVGLGGMGARDPDALSGGQRQRVALARALAPGPRVLLLDEPMSALDARLRERLRVRVKEIQSELGITTVYVTHDQEEALAVSDRLAVLRDGRVEQVDPPRAAYRRPRSRFAAEFLGDNNVFDGERVPAGEGEAIAVAVGDRTFRLAGDGDGDGVDAGATGADRGERVTFCVRPERLRVGAGENRFRATVESAEFLGEATRVHLDWDGRSVTLRTAAAGVGVDTDAGSRTAARAGTTVELGFDPADARVIPDASAAEQADEAGAASSVATDGRPNR